MIDSCDDDSVPRQGSTEKVSPSPSVRTGRVTRFPASGDALVKPEEESLSTDSNSNLYGLRTRFRGYASVAEAV